MTKREVQKIVKTRGWFKVIFKCGSVLVSELLYWRDDNTIHGTHLYLRLEPRDIASISPARERDTER